MLKEAFESMRPKQWYKNLIVLVCVVFSLNLFSTEMLLVSLMAFVIFCGLSSSVYMSNDIMDAGRDRKHPRKKSRPVASGRLKKNHAVVISALMASVSLIGAYLINTGFLLISVSYLLLMALYSMYLKELVVIDLIIISVGFVIRAIAGCLAINAVISPWLIVCAFFLALFLGLGKRSAEIRNSKSLVAKQRKTLNSYTKEMVDQMMGVATSILVVSYSLYTFLSGNTYMMITIPIMAYLLFRYLFLLHKRGIGEETEIIFKDAPMIAAMVVWTLIVIATLYYHDTIASLVS